jgi:hypothetical protein
MEFTEQHVSTNLGHLQVHDSYFSKHIEEWIEIYKMHCEPEDGLNRKKHFVLYINGTQLCLDGFYLDRVTNNTAK